MVLPDRLTSVTGAGAPRRDAGGTSEPAGPREPGWTTPAGAGEGAPPSGP